MVPLTAVPQRTALSHAFGGLAAGLVGAGYGWPAIVVLTGLVNARHILYAAALGPWLRDRPRRSPY